MTSDFKTFWIPGIMALVVVAILKWFDLASRVPFVGDLTGKPGPSGMISVVVIAVTFWVLIALFIRHWATRREAAIVRSIDRVLSRAASSAQSPDLRDILDSLERMLGSGYSNSAFRRRVELLQGRLESFNSPERAAILMAGQSGVDAAFSQGAYGPLRALVWALPGLGFMGTAFEMADAVGGLGEALSQTSGFNDLRGLLVGEVVPHLGGAFSITIFALASSVVCFVILSLVYARDEAVLAHADAVSLKVISRISGEGRPLATTATSREGPLPTEQVQQLILQLQRLNVSLTQLLQPGNLSAMPQHIQGIATLVEREVRASEAILGSLQEERTITVKRTVVDRDGGGGSQQ